jgi:hypothetical protein
LWEVAYKPEALPQFDLDVQKSPRERLYKFLDWGLDDQDRGSILEFMGSDSPIDSVKIIGDDTSFVDEVVTSVFHIAVGTETQSVMFTGWGVSWGQMEWDDEIQIVEPYEKVVIDYKSVMTFSNSNPVK